MLRTSQELPGETHRIDFAVDRKLLAIVRVGVGIATLIFEVEAVGFVSRISRYGGTTPNGNNFSLLRARYYKFEMVRSEYFSILLRRN